MKSTSTATNPQSDPARRLPNAKTYRNAIAPKRASQMRMPSSFAGASPSAIGAATIQNFSGGFSRKIASSCGLLSGLSQSPVFRMPSTA